MNPTPASPPSDDRAEMDALLRAAYPDDSEGHDMARAMEVDDPVMVRILAWHRAEKAAAVADITADRDMWLEIVSNVSTTMLDLRNSCPCDRCQALAKISENQHRLPKTTEQRAYEVIAAAEAAALMRAVEIASTAEARPMGWPEFLTPEKIQQGILDLISPTHRTALAERDAKMREEGRKEGLRQAAGYHREIARVKDIQNQQRAVYQHSKFADEILALPAADPSQPAQGERETS